MPIEDCEIVDNTVLGKSFKYCRTHKKEAPAGNVFDCLEIPDSSGNRGTVSVPSAIGSFLGNTPLIPTTGYKTPHPQPTHAQVPYGLSGPVAAFGTVIFALNLHTYYVLNQNNWLFTELRSVSSVPPNALWFYSDGFTRFEGVPSDPKTWVLS